MRRQGPVTAHCTDSEDFPIIAIGGHRYTVNKKCNLRKSDLPTDSLEAYPRDPLANSKPVWEPIYSKPTLRLGGPFSVAKTEKSLTP